MGSYFDKATKTCVPCAVGSYQSESGQLQCSVCPAIAGRQGVTVSTGARSASQCKEKCPVGKYYDDEAGLCRSCGYGFYQPSEGSFKCLLCGLGKTTRTTEAVSREVSSNTIVCMCVCVCVVYSIIDDNDFLRFVNISHFFFLLPAHRNAEMSVLTVCTWASKANVNRVQEERTGLKAWNRPVNNVRLAEPPNNPALPASKSARCPSACQVKIPNDCRIGVLTTVTKSLTNRLSNGVCRLVLEHHPE